MHPAIQNIISRKKSGSSDGKKIILVLFGGIMLGVRGAGALKALEECGASHAIDEIYTMSSGFLDASYFLSGQIREGFEAYHTDLSGKKFLNPWRFWKVADIPYLLSVITSKRALNVEKILRNRTKLYAMLINTNTHDPEFLEVHSFGADEYPNIIRAASSLPFVANGSIKINNNDYRDIFSNDNIPKLLQKAISTDATDIIVLYNYEWQRDFAHKHTDLSKEKDRVCEICLWDKPMSRFETDSSKLREAGEFAMSKVSEILKSPPPEMICRE